jgi:hypothetical protein
MAVTNTWMTTIYIELKSSPVLHDMQPCLAKAFHIFCYLVFRNNRVYLGLQNILPQTWIEDVCHVDGSD